MQQDSVKGVFYSDVRDKKTIGRGARHRRRGSKTQYVSLPSDNMTEAQWKRRNGEMATYQMGAPIAWSVFRDMPDDLKGEYIRRLHHRFGITAAELAKAFGVSYNTFRKTIGACDMTGVFSAGSKMGAADREAFHCFWYGGNEPAPSVEETSDRQDEPNEPATLPSAAPFTMRSFTLTFDGPYCEEQLLNSLRYMIPAGAEVTLSVTCTVGSEEKM